MSILILIQTIQKNLLCNVITDINIDSKACSLMPILILIQTVKTLLCNVNTDINAHCRNGNTDMNTDREAVS